MTTVVSPPAFLRHCSVRGLSHIVAGPVPPCILRVKVSDRAVLLRGRLRNDFQAIRERLAENCAGCGERSSSQSRPALHRDSSNRETLRHDGAAEVATTFDCRRQTSPNYIPVQYKFINLDLSHRRLRLQGRHTLANRHRPHFAWGTAGGIPKLWFQNSQIAICRVLLKDSVFITAILRTISSVRPVTHSFQNLGSGVLPRISSKLCFTDLGFLSICKNSFFSLGRKRKRREIRTRLPVAGFWNTHLLPHLGQLRRDVRSPIDLRWGLQRDFGKLAYAGSGIKGTFADSVAALEGTFSSRLIGTNKSANGDPGNVSSTSSDTPVEQSQLKHKVNRRVHPVRKAAALYEELARYGLDALEYLSIGMRSPAGRRHADESSPSATPGLKHGETLQGSEQKGKAKRSLWKQEGNAKASGTALLERKGSHEASNGEESDVVEASVAADEDEVEVVEEWVVYCLISEDKKKTYVGVSNDMERRLKQHNGEIPGGAKSTRAGRPWSVLCKVGSFKTRSAAFQFEWKWKHPRNIKGDGSVSRDNLEIQKGETAVAARRKAALMDVLNAMEDCQHLNVQWGRQEKT